jgi:hypothetical protein
MNEWMNICFWGKAQRLPSSFTRGFKLQFFFIDTNKRHGKPRIPLNEDYISKSKKYATKKGTKNKNRNHLPEIYVGGWVSEWMSMQAGLQLSLGWKEQREKMNQTGLGLGTSQISRQFLGFNTISPDYLSRLPF